MPKAEKGTPKDIANRVKSKGLQKLKFYCQMCEKQCRDANGFKCHLTSENHLRQMKIFSDNAGGILDDYSKDFEKMYMATLRMRHGIKRCNANNVYQEVISDKFHVHMNATHWVTLGDFVQYLGKTGKCVVEETERGWYVQYIERDVGILSRQEALRRRLEAEKAAEQAQAERMDIQRVEAAKALDRVGGSIDTKPTNLVRYDGEEAIKLELSTKSKKSAASKVKKGSVFGDDDGEEEEEAPPAPKFEPLVKPSVPKQAVRLDSDSRREDNKNRDDRHQAKRKDADKDDKKESNNKRRREDDDEDRKDYWLHRNIIVRVISKKLAGGKYFRRKAVVDRVIDKFTAEVEILDSDPDTRDGGDILRLDQDDLETMIPSEGKRVRILNGRGRGKKATVMAVDKDRCKATLKLEADETVLEKIQFEDFSKLA
jgi:DNA/RNA-binding protein KIN17